MKINHPRRILVVGAPNTGVLDVIKDLTGSAPTSNETGSTAGLSHEWDVKTAYYTAQVPIWIDEIADTKEWKTEFVKAEAKEVVEAVGAWIYCFAKSHDGNLPAESEQTMQAIQEILETHAGYGADVLMLAVALPRAGSDTVPASDDCEDTCLQYGFEHIDYSATGTNEFGEKQGFARLKEALEANEWADAGPDSPASSFLDSKDVNFDAADPLSDGFNREEAEMTAELFGMKAALMSGEGDDEDGFGLESENFSGTSGQQEKQVDNLEMLVGRLMAVKEQSEGLSEAQRKRMAARAVRELMEG